MGAGGARSRISLGLHSTTEDLNRDWVLTHEMLHFTFPDMPRRHSWIEEGIATYAEPMARAHAGLMPASKVWADMIRDMPQGLPKQGTRASTTRTLGGGPIGAARSSACWRMSVFVKRPATARVCRMLFAPSMSREEMSPSSGRSLAHWAPPIRHSERQSFAIFMPPWAPLPRDSSSFPTFQLCGHNLGLPGRLPA